MLNCVIIIGVLSTIAGIAVTTYSIFMAKEGFEDDKGFHSPQ